jgi:uncharacterized protein YceK
MMTGAGMQWSWVLFLIAASQPLGCQTARSWDEGCPGIYSGVRYFQDDASYLPFDEKIAAVLDLPVSAAVDTILLPATVFMKPRRPAHGFERGCKWVTKR